jgi:hypothetical protein
MIRDDRRASSCAIFPKPEDNMLDGEEDKKTASEQALRVRQAPNGRYKPMLPQTAAARASATNLTRDSDDDEVMIKIDPNATFLEWARTYILYLRPTLTSYLRSLGYGHASAT